MDRDLLKPDPNRIALVIMDIQEKLCTALPQNPLKRLVRYTGVWIEAAQEFGFPLIVTEQYPKGIGFTINKLRTALPEGITPIEKISFSAYGAPAFIETLNDTNASQVIICGVEAHICVYQTALDLLENGRSVFIPADAVLSRTRFTWKNGLDLLQQAGAVVGNTETFIYQMLKAAGSDRFKKFSRLLR